MYTKEELEKLSIKDLVEVYLDIIDHKKNTRSMFYMCVGNMLDELEKDERNLVDNEIDILLSEAHDKCAEAYLELFNKDELITSIMFYGNNQSLIKKLPALNLRVQDLLSRSVESFGKRLENILG